MKHFECECVKWSGAGMGGVTQVIGDRMVWVVERPGVENDTIEK